MKPPAACLDTVTAAGRVLPRCDAGSRNRRRFSGLAGSGAKRFVLVDPIGFDQRRHRTADCHGRQIAVADAHPGVDGQQPLAGRETEHHQSQGDGTGPTNTNRVHSRSR